MPALRNARRERFAQELVKGKSVEAAYKAAGYRPHHANAHRLRGNEDVAARVSELQGRASAHAVYTVDKLVDMLEEDRALARSSKQSGAAVSATMGVAKLLGKIVDRHSHKNEQHGLDLSALTEKERATFERLLAKISVVATGASAPASQGAGGEDG